MPHLHLRAETKTNERRTPLTPSLCEGLVGCGFRVSVERCPLRIFRDQEYAAYVPSTRTNRQVRCPLIAINIQPCALLLIPNLVPCVSSPSSGISVGCHLVEHASWKTAPSDAYVIALKELPDNDNCSLMHTHIMFGHCYKKQAGWRDLLTRFSRGNGKLLDIEFLKDPSGKRVAAFGYYAGFAGSALGIDLWCHKQLNGPSVIYPAVKPYENENDLINHLQTKLKTIGRYPKIMVIGALGRCGSGACDLTTRLGFPAEKIVKWDMAETSIRSGPYDEILDADIFVNCIYLTSEISPFLTLNQLSKKNRNLSVIVDVSCDATNPFNPIPVYTEITTFENPVTKVITENAKDLDVISIDHLPSLLPREASEAFALDFKPTLLELKDRSNSFAWRGAEDVFNFHVNLLNE